MKRAKHIVNAILIVFLFILFTVPRAHVLHGCGEMTAQATAAAAAVRVGDDPGPYLAALETLYEKNSPRWKLFLHHDSVSALGTAIGACAPLTDASDLLAALNAVSVSLMQLCSIERFDWCNLL